MEAAGKADHAGLGGRVSREHRPGVVGAAAGDVYDLAATLGLHDLDRLAAAFDDGDEVDVEHVLDDVVFHVGYFGDLDAGTVIVDEDVEAAEAFLGGLQEFLPIVGRDGVCLDGQEVLTGKVACRPVEALLVASRDDHVGAHFQQNTSRFEAESGGTARDDDDLAFYVVFHGVFLGSCVPVGAIR